MSLKPPTLLVDMDFFCYRAAQAAEDELEFSSDLTVIVGDHLRGRRIVRQSLQDFKDRFESDDFILFWTDTKNFRKDIDPTYKGNRTRRKPAGYLKLKRWCMDTWKSVLLPGLEADDALGIAATKGDISNFVLISPDKDLEQIPCRIFNLKNEFTQTPEEAEFRLYFQCLTGDSVDGFSGAPGIGPKRATAVLSNCEGDYWRAVVDTFEKCGLSEAEALRNLRLARILQVQDWDAKKQKPILFTP